MLSATALATILTTNGICTAEIGLANAEELAMVYGMKADYFYYFYGIRNNSY
jgi:hypothetical protein